MRPNAGRIIIATTPGRRVYDQSVQMAWEADVRGGALVQLVHRDLVESELVQFCSGSGGKMKTCGRPIEVRCDYPRKERNGERCNRLMCRVCAVTIPAFNDCHVCVRCAREAGVVFSLDDEERAKMLEGEIPLHERLVQDPRMLGVCAAFA